MVVSGGVVGALQGVPWIDFPGDRWCGCTVVEDVPWRRVREHRVRLWENDGYFQEYFVGGWGGWWWLIGLGRVEVSCDVHVDKVVVSIDVFGDVGLVYLCVGASLDFCRWYHEVV